MDEQQLKNLLDEFGRRFQDIANSMGSKSKAGTGSNAGARTTTTTTGYYDTDDVYRMKQIYSMHKSMNKSIKTYVSYLDDIRELDEEILYLQKKQKTATEDENKNIKKRIEYLEKEKKAIKEVIDLTNKGLLKNKNLYLGIASGLSKIPNLISNGYGKIKNLGLFEMDKSIRKSALSMGILTKQTSDFRSDIVNSAKYTTDFGMYVKDLAELQASYSGNLGKNVMLNEQGLKQMSAMAVATGLGADEAGRMAAEFYSQGLSAERTSDFVEKTLNSSTSMGLNATKVVRNIQSNIRLLNRYNFKGGIEGLKKMAQTTTKLGIEMTAISGMADKLFDIEGAVDMSAQLQVMGGAWAKLSDPFKLMYMARNDMEGLTAEIGKAAEASVTFDKATGQFKISALEMHRLRKIAEQTGIAYEDLAQAGKNARIQTEIKKQISMRPDKQTEEFISNTAKFDETGKAYIYVKEDGKTVKKYLNQLSKANIDLISSQAKETKTLKERAELSQNFDDRLSNFIETVKIGLLPIIDTMNEELIPKLKDLKKKFIEGDWWNKLTGFAKMVGSVASAIGGFIIEYPKISAGLFLAAKALGGLQWFLYGTILGQGFLSVTRGGAGLAGLISGKAYTPSGKAYVSGGKAFSTATGKELNVGASNAVLNSKGMFGRRFGAAFKSGGSIFSGALSGLGYGFEEYNEEINKGKTSSEALGKAAFAGGGAALGSMGLMAAAAALAPATGGLSLLLPLLAGAAGGYVGAKAGEGLGSLFMDDGIVSTKNKTNVIFNPNDKFLKVNDATMIAGTKEGGNQSLANALNNQQKNVKIEYGEIKFKFDDLIVRSDNNQMAAINLANNPQFMNEITKAVHKTTKEILNNGKESKT